MKRIVFALAILLSTAYASALSFSKQHGFCDAPFDLAITEENMADGMVIRYTLDGSEPTVTSALYSTPLHVSHNTIIRAAVMDANGVVTSKATATYLFDDDVLNQPMYPDGYPTTWGAFTTISGTAPADYGMSAEMAADPVLAQKIKEGLRSLPVLSIVTDKGNLFNKENDPDKGGIYIYTGPPVGDPTGNDWIRHANVELFGNGHDFTVPCGLRLHGGHGRVAEKNPKHSMRLVFKEEYGQKNLKYNLFGKGEPNQFKQLVLRCHFGNSWQHWAEYNRTKAQYTRDVWARRMQRKMGWTSVNALYVHVFLNGMYWGLYNIAERVNDQYGSDHLGGKKSEIDVVKIEEEGGNHHEAAEGDLEAWELMVETAAKAADDTYYYMLQGKDAEGNDNQEMEALLDIDNFIDYMLINQYGGNNDWDHHNWYAIRRKGTESQGYRFLCWDSELVLEGVNDNVIDKNSGNAFPTGILNNLLRNEKFAKRYLKRAKEVLADDGLLGQISVEEVWDSLYNNISKALYAEAARWGDYRRDVHQYQSKGALYTVDGTYMTERNRLHNEYFPQRSSIVLNKIKTKLAIDDFEPQADWVRMTADMFYRWNGSGVDATQKEAIDVDWKLNTSVSNGTPLVGLSSVDHDVFVDISNYEKILIRGNGGNLRILANRLVAHGEWKEINTRLDSSSPYWDEELGGLLIPTDELRTKLTSSNNNRVDDFAHLDAIKPDWNNTVFVSSIWLIPSETADFIKELDNSGLKGKYSDDSFYNLNGQKIQRPSKGLFIHKGKKMVVR